MKAKGKEQKLTEVFRKLQGEETKDMLLQQAETILNTQKAVLSDVRSGRISGVGPDEKMCERLFQEIAHGKIAEPLPLPGGEAE